MVFAMLLMCVYRVRSNGALQIMYDFEHNHDLNLFAQCINLASKHILLYSVSKPHLGI